MERQQQREAVWQVWVTAGFQRSLRLGHAEKDKKHLHSVMCSVQVSLHYRWTAVCFNNITRCCLPIFSTKKLSNNTNLNFHYLRAVGRHCNSSGIFRNLKKAAGYISGVHFQKSLNFSINFFSHYILVQTNFFTSKADRPVPLNTLLTTDSGYSLLIPLYQTGSIPEYWPFRRHCHRTYTNDKLLTRAQPCFKNRGVPSFIPCPYKCPTTAALWPGFPLSFSLPPLSSKPLKYSYRGSGGVL